MTKSENDYRQERMEDYPLEHKFDIGTMDLESKTLVPKNQNIWEIFPTTLGFEWVGEGIVSNSVPICNNIFREFLSVMSPDGSPNSFPSQSPTSSTSLSLVPASNVTTVSSSSLYITENSSVSFVQQWLRLKKFHNFQSKEIRQKIRHVHSGFLDHTDQS